MGYNLSVHSVVRNLPQLEMLASERRTLTFPTDEPRRLAYKLREAIRAAKEHDEFRHLHAAIWPNYAFREERNGVVAEFIGTDSMPADGEKPPLRSTELRPTKKTLPRLTALVEVLATAIKYSAEQTLYFPDARLSYEDKVKLYEWCFEREWEILDHDDGGITLTKEDIPGDLLFTPEELG